jgi:heme A synthase
VNTLTVVLEIGIFAGGLVLAWAHGWNNAWYTSRIGRGIVGLGLVLAVLTGIGVLRRLLNWPLPDWAMPAAFAVVLAVVIGLDIAFVRMRIEEHRAQAAERNHRTGGGA